MPPFRDRERAAHQLAQLELVVFGALAKIGDRLLDLGKAQSIGAANDRHCQPLPPPTATPMS